MRHGLLIFSLISGLSIAAGQMANAQSTVNSSQSVTTTSSLSPRFLRLRLLSPDGSITGQILVETGKGSIRFGANEATISGTSNSEDVPTVRLEGNITVKVTRAGVDTVLLELNRDDAIIEYETKSIVTDSKASQTVERKPLTQKPAPNAQPEVILERFNRFDAVFSKKQPTGKTKQYGETAS